MLDSKTSQENHTKSLYPVTLLKQFIQLTFKADETLLQHMNKLGINLATVTYD